MEIKPEMKKIIFNLLDFVSWRSKNEKQGRMSMKEAKLCLTYLLTEDNEQLNDEEFFKGLDELISEWENKKAAHKAFIDKLKSEYENN